MLAFGIAFSDCFGHRRKWFVGLGLQRLAISSSLDEERLVRRYFLPDRYRDRLHS